MVNDIWNHMIARDKQMGDAIIEKDVVQLDIMHDMMQFMVLFHYFMQKFFSQRHKSVGGCRKLN